MSEQFRNQYVIHQEGGHPGYRQVSVFATKEDLAKLGNQIIEATNKEQVDVYVYAALEHGQSSRVYLNFRSKTSAEIDGFHIVPTRSKVFAVLWPLTLVALLILAIRGLWSLV